MYILWGMEHSMTHFCTELLDNSLFNFGLNRYVLKCANASNLFFGNFVCSLILELTCRSTTQSLSFVTGFTRCQHHSRKYGHPRADREQRGGLRLGHPAGLQLHGQFHFRFWRKPAECGRRLQNKGDSHSLTGMRNKSRKNLGFQETIKPDKKCQWLLTLAAKCY